MVGENKIFTIWTAAVESTDPFVQVNSLLVGVLRTKWLVFTKALPLTVWQREHFTVNTHFFLYSLQPQRKRGTIIWCTNIDSHCWGCLENSDGYDNVRATELKLQVIQIETLKACVCDVGAFPLIVDDIYIYICVCVCIAAYAHNSFHSCDENVCLHDSIVCCLSSRWMFHFRFRVCEHWPFFSPYFLSHHYFIAQVVCEPSFHLTVFVLLLLFVFSYRYFKSDNSAHDFKFTS